MEPKKSYRKIRCVSIKGDHIRYIPEHCVDELCKMYKLVKQDIGEVNEQVKTSETTCNTEVLWVQPTFVEAKAEYETLTGKKAGNKKLETILKEIEEVKNKQ
jgi:CRISPR/Cas system-associated endoribonuclease Cas2